MTFLAELSLRDIKWDERKRVSVTIARKFCLSEEFEKRGNKMLSCSCCLKFKLDDGDLKLAVPTKQDLVAKRNYFCRDRLCMTCQWRRRIKMKLEASRLMGEVEKAFPGYRWLFLTLTVKNCHISELKDNIALMNKAFRKWTGSVGGKNKSLSWPAVGWLKALEVTRNHDTQEAHPHFHVMLMVEPNYYKSSLYLNQKKLEWSLLWQKALGVDYVPSVNIKPADLDKQHNIISPALKIPELVKYVTKQADISFAPTDWLYEYARQMYHVKRFEPGGVLRSIMGSLAQEDDEDLIGATDNLIGAAPIFLFTWNSTLRVPRYELVA